MKMTLGDEHAINTKVWLDGVSQIGAIEIDTDAGYIVRYKMPFRILSSGYADTEKVYGRVETSRTDIGFGA